MGVKEDLRKKLKDIAWWVAIAVVRWVLERLTKNPREHPGGGDHSERE